MARDGWIEGASLLEIDGMVVRLHQLLVADRRMTALLSPAPAGAYIVVAESPKAVKRAQKLFVQG